MSEYRAALADILETIERIRGIIGETSFEVYAQDFKLRWLCERGLEIVSEASRRIPEDVKTAHPAMPWRQIAGMGNFLRHEYHRIDDRRVWTTARFELEPIETVCRAELTQLGPSEPAANGNGPKQRPPTREP